MSTRKTRSLEDPRQEIRSLEYSIWTTAQRLSLIGLLLFLAALVSPVSQAAMAPIYGSVPSGVNHKTAVTLAVILGNSIAAYTTQRSKIIIHISTAVWASFLPLVTLLETQLSGSLGPIWGPITLGTMTCHAVLIPIVWLAAKEIESLQASRLLGITAGVLIPVMTATSSCILMESYFAAKLPQIMVSFPLINPTTLQLLIASVLSLLSSSKWMGLAAPALVYTLLLSPFMPTSVGMFQLNNSLARHNWTILDRAWSTTGYVSVLESTSQHYRVLRCDHSLLGGEWLLTPSRATSEKWKVNEPIYSVFAMLEAVRLLELDPEIPDLEAKALVIGLGIGTAPAALIKHGIDTTIVELDPAVHKFATQYFSLPSNHTAALSDAIAWAAAAQASQQRYDYILHDVFTGGAEPLALFTVEFLTQLRTLISPNGVIALNYAGDLSLPLTQHVLHTIAVVFQRQCKIFRDTKPPAQTSAESQQHDFLNMVIFCRNTPGPLNFRKPTSRDFLGSKSRAHYLLPRKEWEIAFPETQDDDAGGRGAEIRGVEDILKAGDEQKWASQQIESAQRHWRIMRGVLPDRVWELW